MRRAWLPVGLLLMLLAGCVEGQKPTPLKRGDTSVAHSPTDKAVAPGTEKTKAPGD